jgi:hypothetical protein
MRFLLGILLLGLLSSAQACFVWWGCEESKGALLGNVPFIAARFPVGNYVYTPEDLKTISYAGTGEEVSDVWLPNLEDITALETAFKATLTSKATMKDYDPYKEALESYNTYQRQYMGVVINDNKFILANFDRCSEFEKGQLEAYFISLLPSDGESCFIETLYDPKTRAFARFYLHGFA